MLSRHIIQRAWGVSDIEIDRYVDFQNGTCQIGGEKCIQVISLENFDFKIKLWRKNNL